MKYICAGCGWAREFDDENNPMQMVEEVSKHIFDDHAMFDRPEQDKAVIVLVDDDSIAETDPEADRKPALDILCAEGRCKKCGAEGDWSILHKVVKGWGLRHVLACPECGEQVPDFLFGSYISESQEGDSAAKDISDIYGDE